MSNPDSVFWESYLSAEGLDVIEPIGAVSFSALRGAEIDQAMFRAVPEDSTVEAVERADVVEIIRKSLRSEPQYWQTGLQEPGDADMTKMRYAIGCGAPRSMAEIAEAHGVPTTTVQSRLSRSRKIIGEYLLEQHPNYFTDSDALPSPRPDPRVLSKKWWDFIDHYAHLERRSVERKKSADPVSNFVNAADTANSAYNAVKELEVRLAEAREKYELALEQAASSYDTLESNGN